MKSSTRKNNPKSVCSLQRHLLEQLQLGTALFSVGWAVWLSAPRMQTAQECCQKPGEYKRSSSLNYSSPESGDDLPRLLSLPPPASDHSEVPALQEVAEDHPWAPRSSATLVFQVQEVQDRVRTPISCSPDFCELIMPSHTLGFFSCCQPLAVQPHFPARSGKLRGQVCHPLMLP